MQMIKKLKVTEINMTAGTQIRASLDDATVQEYATAMQEGVSFPPAIVFEDGGQYILADGFHRVTAAIRNHRNEFEFDVRPGGRSEALRFALSANAQHGLRRTNADKRRSVELALAEWPRLSSAEIGRICAVSHPFVEGLREEIQPATVTGCSRIGRDGKERRLPPPPMRPRGTSPTDRTSGTDRTNATDAQGTPHPASGQPNLGLAVLPSAEKGIEAERERVTPPPPGWVVDGTGWPIPTQLIPLWQRASEVQELLTILSRVKGTLRSAQENRDTLFAEVNFSSALSQLDQAWTDVKTAKPFAVCPTCQGQVPDQCTLCRGRGLISEYRWNTCVTREDKEFRFRAKRETKAETLKVES
jgi:hypothetical protein